MHHLVYRDAQGGTKSFSLEGRLEASVGRGNERDLVLSDRQVSRHHATFEQLAGTFLLRDLGSANGTFLNGLRLSGTSAIALRDGDVIEIGSFRLCFATEVALAHATLAPVDETPGSAYLEATLLHADLLRDGQAWLREHEREPDETSDLILGAFAGGSLAAGLTATLDLLKKRLRVDVAAAFVRQRRRAPLELLAARPDESHGTVLAQTFDVAGAGLAARLFHRVEEDDSRINFSDTCTDPPEHSAALVPFFRGESLLGVLAVERFRGPRIDRKQAAIVAVYGERVSRALSVRLASPNDTAFDFAGGAA